MSHRSPPRKLNLGDLVLGSSLNAQQHSQGIAALFAITFDIRVYFSNFLRERADNIGRIYHYMAKARE